MTDRSDKGVPPPGAAVAYRRILKDPRDEPQYAERVPYIVSNAEGRRLIDRARMPEEMIANRWVQLAIKDLAGTDDRRSLGIDAEYYIRNLLIPPLSRIFNLVGADVEHWYDSMPRTKRAGKYDLGSAHKTRIDSHFRSSHCVVCGTESSTSKLGPVRALRRILMRSCRCLPRMSVRPVDNDTCPVIARISCPRETRGDAQDLRVMFLHPAERSYSM